MSWWHEFHLASIGFHSTKCKKKAHNCRISIHRAVSQQHSFVSVGETLSSVSCQPFPRKRNASHFSSDFWEEVHDGPSACSEYPPGRQRIRPQWRHLSVTTKLCGCNCVVTPTALNSTCIVYMQEYRKAVRAIPAAVVCSLFALFYVSCGKCWWNSWEGVCFSWHSRGTGQNKVSIDYTGSSNIYMNVAVPASILSQITQVKSQ